MERGYSESGEQRARGAGYAGTAQMVIVHGKVKRSKWAARESIIRLPEHGDSGEDVDASIDGDNGDDDNNDCCEAGKQKEAMLHDDIGFFV